MAAIPEEEIRKLPQEFQEMLTHVDPVTGRVGMTLAEACAHHRKHWNFPKDAGLQHEVGHLIAGLSGITPYQATWDVEIYNLAYESNIAPSFSSNRGFNIENLSRRSQGLAREHESYVNFERTLTWLEGRKTGESMEVLRRKRHYEDNAQDSYEASDADILAELGQKCGIAEIKRNPRIVNESRHKEWMITTADGETFSFNENDRKQDGLPKGSNGRDTFKPYAVPDMDTIRANLAKVQPAVLYVQGIMLSGSSGGREERLGAINIRDVFAAHLAAQGKIAPNAQVAVPADSVLLGGADKLQR